MSRLLLILLVPVLAGCVGPARPVEPVVDQDESMEFLERGLRPEILLFPQYLLMDGFELNQHGRIPSSSLVGGGLKTAFGLSMARSRFSDVLVANHWTIENVEIGKGSFRIMASLAAESIEIRGVQGRGPTEIFILFQPAVEAGSTAL